MKFSMPRHLVGLLEKQGEQGSYNRCLSVFIDGFGLLMKSLSNLWMFAMQGFRLVKFWDRR